PIIGDPERKVASLYGMIHPNASDTLTVRSVFFIDPNRKVRAMITYPASTGRDFNEILRVLDSLQLTDQYKVATPANWKQGDEGPDPVVVRREGGERDRRDRAASLAVELPHPGDELISVLVRHGDVTDQDVRVEGLERAERLGGGGHRGHACPVVLEERVQ